MTFNAPSHAARLEINLSALKNNWLHCKTLSGEAECGAAVKADAYGLGLAECSKALWSAGCKSFFVAHLDEGIALRSILPLANIYVLHGFIAKRGADYRIFSLIPVCSREEDVAFAAGLPIALMVDTGMNRLGLSLEAAKGFTALSNVHLIMSHFACADVPQNALNHIQMSRFQEITDFFKGIPASLSNSDGLAFNDAQYQLTRPGIALYDGVESVVKLSAKILQVRTVLKGDAIGYGATFTAHENRDIALLSIGYADGLMRAGQGAFVRVQEKLCPIIGRISMDLTAVDVTGLNVKTGESAVIFDEKLRITPFAKQASTINYEILTRLGARLQRHYI